MNNKGSSSFVTVLVVALLVTGGYYFLLSRGYINENFRYERLSSSLASLKVKLNNEKLKSAEGNWWTEDEVPASISSLVSEAKTGFSYLSFIYDNDGDVAKSKDNCSLRMRDRNAGVNLLLEGFTSYEDARLAFTMLNNIVDPLESDFEQEEKERCGTLKWSENTIIYQLADTDRG